MYPFRDPTVQGAYSMVFGAEVENPRDDRNPFGITSGSKRQLSQTMTCLPNEFKQVHRPLVEEHVYSGKRACTVLGLTLRCPVPEGTDQSSNC